MSSRAAGLDVLSAVGFLGEPVLVELVWDDDPDPFWRFGHVIGVVLPVEGVHEQPFLIVKSPGEEYPLEVFLSDIQSIRVSLGEAGNCLGSLPPPYMLQGQTNATEGERRYA